MTLSAMDGTRQPGQIKRLDAIRSLVVAGRNLPPVRQHALTDIAVASATGLKEDSSRNNFRRDCKNALHNLVAQSYEDIERFARRVWSEKRSDYHSLYHIVMPICVLMKGRRGRPPMDLNSIEKFYDNTGTIPESRPRRAATSPQRRR